MKNNLRTMDSKAETLIHLHSNEEVISTETNANCDKDAELAHQGAMSDSEKNYNDMYRGHDHDLDDIDSGDDLDDDDMLMDMENKRSSGSGGHSGSGRQYGGGASGNGSGFPEDDKRKRRAIANSNERRRMQSINAGFQTLKSLIPHSSGEKLSKACILQRSADFMRYLSSDKEKLNSKLQIALKLIESNGLLSLYQNQISSELGLSLSSNVAMSGPASSSKPSSTKINKQPTISNISAIASTASTAKNQTTILQPVSLNETIHCNTTTDASSAQIASDSTGAPNPVSPFSSKQAATSASNAAALLTPIAPNKSANMPAPIVLSRKSAGGASTTCTNATGSVVIEPSSGKFTQHTVLMPL